MRFFDLKHKEVINVQSCRSLGCVSDLDIDCKTGCIQAIIVPGPGKMLCLFGRESEYVIPWECVRQIGEDIILVEIREERCLRQCG